MARKNPGDSGGGGAHSSSNAPDSDLPPLGAPALRALAGRVTRGLSSSLRSARPRSQRCTAGGPKRRIRSGAPSPPGAYRSRTAPDPPVKWLRRSMTEAVLPEMTTKSRMISMVEYPDWR